MVVLPYVNAALLALSVDMIFSGILDIKPKDLAQNLKGFDYINMEAQ